METTTNSLALLTNTCIAGTVVSYSQTVAEKALLWVLPCVFAVFVDLIYGIKAANYRKERVTFSSALRRTGSKLLGYSCWIIMAVACQLAFGVRWMTPTLMGIVLFIEFCSIMCNVLEPKGKTINSNAIIRWIAKRLGTETEEDVIISKDETTKSE